MSSVAVPLYHYALLKGYLSGQNPPLEALAAVEALYMAAIQGPLRADAIEAIQAVKEAAEKLAGIATASPAVGVSITEPQLPIAATETAEPDLPPITKRALEKATERVATPEPSDQPQTDKTKIAAFLESKAAELCPPAHAAGDGHEVVVGPSEPKKRKPWSQEAREAAAERMRARQAAGLMKGRKKEPDLDQSPEPADQHEEAPKAGPSPRPKPSPVIDHERLIASHNSYAGKREDGQLVDADWPDIKSRLSKGDTKAAIASDYDAEPEDLDFFIASNQRREAKQPAGEARALIRS